MDIPGYILRAARAALDLGQQDLADALEMSRATIKKIEDGDQAVLVSSVARLREELEARGVEFIYPSKDGGPGMRMRTGKDN